MRGLLENFQTVFAFILVVGAAIWVGTIYMARNEQRLEQACLPIEYATNALHQVTTALVGFPPRWTLSLQSYLMAGCYYFFSVMLPDGSDASTDGVPLPSQGGVRTQ